MPYLGGCPTIVTTTDDEGLPYNDDQWHHMRAIRNGLYGMLYVDFKWTGDSLMPESLILYLYL